VVTTARALRTAGADVDLARIPSRFELVTLPFARP
jgi:hypothetical protein